MKLGQILYKSPHPKNRRLCVFEKLCTNSSAGFRRTYSLKLNNGISFDRGSRRLFLISANGVDFRKCFQLRVWINYDGKDVIWSPEKISVFKPRSREIPLMGAIYNDAVFLAGSGHLYEI